MGEHGHVQRAGQLRNREHMVEMCVGEQHREHVQIRGRGQDALRLVAGIHDQRAAVAGRVQHPAVGIEHADDDTPQYGPGAHAAAARLSRPS